MKINYSLNLNDLKNWDIVYALVCQSQLKNKEVLSKKYRPFLLTSIDYETKMAKGYEFTTAERQRRENSFHVVTPEKYNIKKPSFILLGNPITISLYSVIDLLDKLDKEDQNEIIRKLVSNQKEEEQNKHNRVRVGDLIISDNITYYIYRTSKYNYSGFPIDICSNQEHDFTFEFDSRKYKLDFEHQKSFVIDEQVCFSFPNDIIKQIDYIKEQRIDNNETKPTSNEVIDSFVNKEHARRHKWQ